MIRRTRGAGQHLRFPALRRMPRHRQPPGCKREPPAPVPGRSRASDGALSLEAVMILPILALLVTVLLQTAALVTDVLVLHEAARAGARAAATTSGSPPVVAAAKHAAPELPDITVHVDPVVRGDGDLVRVDVGTTRSIGPVTHRLSATAHTRVEPAVGTMRRQPGR